MTEPWPELEDRVRLMFKIMYARGWARGVGLSACQVGWNVQLFVMNPDRETKKPEHQRIYWNPESVELIGEPVRKIEACLSLPRVTGPVLRYNTVRFKAMSPRGPVEEEFTDFAAQIVQHELGHLKGELCSDHFLPPEPPPGLVAVPPEVPGEVKP